MEENLLSEAAVRSIARSLLIAGLVAFVLGCENGTSAPETVPPVEPTPREGTLVLSGKGFHATTNPLGGNLLYYAFTVKNADMHRAFRDTSYEVRLLDGAGAEIVMDGGVLPVVLPNQSTAAAVQLRVPRIPTTMEVNLVVGASEVVGLLTAFGPFDARYIAPAFGPPSVEATIANPFPVEIENWDAVAVLYDRQGNIQGGWYEDAGRLPASGTLAISINFIAPPLVEPAHVLVFPSLSDIELEELR